MGFIKVVKNKSYFKRYQVKFRRRREGKTDFYARSKLIKQAKNKYNTPKYRLIVRFTNTDIICQIAYSKIKGDVIMTAAYGHELKRYGLKVGFTNYASAYAVGLLLARRHLKKLKLDEKYEGKPEVNGQDWKYDEEELEFDGGPRPFICFLDVGLKRTTTGARIFAAMKGACDGGLNIPHDETRFVGYKGGKFDPKKLQHYLFGGHVADYMRFLQKKDPTKYKKQFSKYIDAGIAPEKIAEIYKGIHKAIRANPEHQKPDKKPFEGKRKRYRQVKRTLAQRKARIAQIKAAKQAS